MKMSRYYLHVTHSLTRMNYTTNRSIKSLDSLCIGVEVAFALWLAETFVSLAWRPTRQSRQRVLDRYDI